MSDNSSSAKLAEMYSRAGQPTLDLLRNKYGFGMEVFNETSKAYDSMRGDGSSQQLASGKQQLKQQPEYRVSDLTASHKQMHAYVQVVNVSDRVEIQYMRKLAEIAQSVSRFSELREKHNVLLKEAKKSFDEQTEDLNPNGDKQIAQSVAELKERLENKIEELCSIIGDLALRRGTNPPQNTTTTRCGTVEHVASTENTVTTRKGDVIPRDAAPSKSEAALADSTARLSKKIDNEASSTVNSKKDPKMTLENVVDNCKHSFLKAVEPLEEGNFVTKVEVARKTIRESLEAELKELPDCSRIMRRRQEEALSDVLDRIHCEKAKSLTIDSAVVKLSRTRTNNVEAVVADARAWYITATEQVKNKQIRKKGLEECQEKIQEFARTPMSRRQEPRWLPELMNLQPGPFLMTSLIQTLTSGTTTSGQRNQPQ